MIRCLKNKNHELFEGVRNLKLNLDGLLLKRKGCTFSLESDFLKCTQNQCFISNREELTLYFKNERIGITSYVKSMSLMNRFLPDTIDLRNGCNSMYFQSSERVFSRKLGNNLFILSSQYILNRIHL